MWTRSNTDCRAAWLGLSLDAEANADDGPRISAAGSRTTAWVIPTNEELMIARHTGRLLGLVDVGADALGATRSERWPWR